MIKNVVFDIGQVLVTFEPLNYFKDYFQDELQTQQLCSMIFADSAWGLYDQGIYQISDLKKIYCEKYPHVKEQLLYILEHWLELMKLKEDTFAYLLALKQQGYNIYLLSNISKDSELYLKSCMPFFEECDGEILSHIIKVNKPSKEIYKALFAKYHLIPNECIFFDDRLENIEMACKLGMHGILFEDCESAQQAAIACIEREHLC